MFVPLRTKYNNLDAFQMCGVVSPSYNSVTYKEGIERHYLPGGAD